MRKVAAAITFIVIGLFSVQQINAEPTGTPTVDPTNEPTSEPTVEPTIPVSPTLPFYCLGECLAPPTPTKKPAKPTPTRRPAVTGKPVKKPTATVTSVPEPTIDPCKPHEKPGKGPKESKKKHKKYKDGRDGGVFKTIFKFVFNLGNSETATVEENESTTAGKKKPCISPTIVPEPTVIKPTDKPVDPCVETNTVQTAAEENDVTTQTNGDGFFEAFMKFIFGFLEMILKFITGAPGGSAPCPPGTSPVSPTQGVYPTSGTIPTTEVIPTSTLSIAPTAPIEPTQPCTNTQVVSQTANEDQNVLRKLLETLIQLIQRLLALLTGTLPPGTGPQPQPDPSNPSNPCTNTSTPVGNAQPTTAQQQQPLQQPTAAPQTATKVAVGKRVVFAGDFDTGNLGQWANCQWKGRNNKCSGTGDSYMAKLVNDGPGHETAVRFELRPGDIQAGGERTEVRGSGSSDVREGDERWYEFQLKFPDDFKTPNSNYFIVMQWHSSSGSPPMAIEVNKNNVLEIRNNRDNKQVYAVGPIQRGKWTNYVLHTKFSNNKNNGFVQIYENGVEKLKKTPFQNMAGSSNYLKMGIYRGKSGLTHVVYHDGLKITAP